MGADLLAKSRKYFALAGSDDDAKPLAADIRFDLHRLLSRVERLERKFPKFQIIAAAGQLMDSMTGDDFDSLERVKESLDSDRMIRIESDLHHVLNCLEDGHADTFK